MSQEGKRPGKGDILSAVGRYKYVILVLLAGIALMLWPRTEQAESAEDISRPEVEESTDAMERELAQILSRIQGVGKVEVMLTLQSGGELVLAQDQSLRYSGSTQAPDDYDRSSQTVTISDSGREDVIVTQQRYPQYRGALIVCEGGGSDAVRLQVIKAVSVLTGLGSDCISVVKWGSGGLSEAVPQA